MEQSIRQPRVFKNLCSYFNFKNFITILLFFHLVPAQAVSKTSKSATDKKSVEKNSAKNSAMSSPERTLQNLNDIQIKNLDPDFEVEEFEKSGYNIDRSENYQQAGDGLPLPQVRDQILESSGLLPRIMKWDHLERDILVLRAKQYSLTQISSMYPNLPKANLQHLQRLVLSYGKGRK